MCLNSDMCNAMLVTFQPSARKSNAFAMEPTGEASPPCGHEDRQDGNNERTMLGLSPVDQGKSVCAKDTTPE